jgi:hypothetical protein
MEYLVVTVLLVALAIAWVRWRSERLSLSGHRRLIGTIGLIGSSSAFIGCLILAIHSSRVHGVEGDEAIFDWAAGLLWFALGSFVLSWFGRGISRALSAGAALILVLCIGVAFWAF